jgi:hypothetical protein
VAAVTKSGLPRKAFAYAPTADPSTWRLPYLTSAGQPDPVKLPKAASGITEAEVPNEFLPAVKSRLRQAYRRWQGSKVEYPDGIKEVAVERDGVTVREATILLDKGSTYAKVVFTPEGDALVIPDYDGAFFYAAKPWTQPAGDLPAGADWSARWDAQDAADVLKKLLGLKGGEEADQQAMLDQAISGVTDFIRAESAEIEATCAGCGHGTLCVCTVCACATHGAMAEAATGFIEALASPAFRTAFAEAGQRNSAKDKATLLQIVELVKTLGVEVIPPAPAPAPEADPDTAPAPVAEAHIDATAKPEDVTFREASYDTQVVTLAEASPLFDKDTRTVWVTPIKPGWGNARDNNFYPVDTLKEATVSGKFNHLKMFKDHPRKSDEKDLPERSVDRWFATTREAVWDEAKQQPRVPIKVHEDSDFRRMEEAPEQVAFSVLGGGRARAGSVEGKAGKIIESIEKLRSVDWVTEAGAGGAIAFAESATGINEELEVDITNMTVEQLNSLKESNPALYEHVIGLAKAAVAPAAPAAAPAAPAAPAVEPVREAAAADAPPAWAAGLIATVEDLKGKVEGQTKVTEAVVAKDAAAKIVKAQIGESTLPAKAKATVEARFAEAKIGAGGYADEAALKEAVSSELTTTEELLKPFLGASRVRGLGAAGGDGKPAASIQEAAATAIAARMGGSGAPRKQRLVFEPEELQGGPAAPQVSATTPVEEGKPGVYAVGNLSEVQPRSTDGQVPVQFQNPASQAAYAAIAGRA